MTTFGWDASDFDWDRGPMDLAAARRDGISFFTHKATEGTDVQHVHYGTALARAKAAAVPFIGAYHVVRSVNVDRQLSFFLAYVNAQTPWWRDFPGWFWQVDQERWPYDNVDDAYGASFGSELARETGRGVLEYASAGQYGNGIDGSLALWNANYGGNPAGHFRELYPGDSGAGWARYSGRVPAVWQYGSRTTIGSQPTCDANAFRGTEDDFARLIGAPTTPEDDMITYVQEMKVPGHPEKGLYPAVWKLEGGFLDWLSSHDLDGSRSWAVSRWKNAFDAGNVQHINPGDLGCFGALRPGTAVPPAGQWSGAPLRGYAPASS